MTARYSEAPMTIRADGPLRAALRQLADQDGTNVSEFLRRELRAMVARKRAGAAANDNGGKGDLQ
ncbi:hypothetical protein [Camelimonas lactis]|uniref:Ribbon-helix-helix CopG family protein n=1 Tax=Camelimonas lactis TaxID=659006 RepID=A0A4R2GGS3_9HYPH|nr:hypothetical protein [Camelimonas lactis]TCO07529.1 hypothetical protein EV666_13210 [Camelimonas lactis]